MSKNVEDGILNVEYVYILYSYFSLFCTEIRFLPWLLRRASTFLPFLVLLRFR